MSSNEDPPELKAKYAEIAALKKAINAKQMNQASNKPIPASYSANRGGFRGGFRGSSSRGGFRGGKRGVNKYRNMTVFFNNEIKSKGDEESGNENEMDSEQNIQYISEVSKGGMSLVNSNIYQQDKAKYAERAAELKAKLKLQRQLDIARFRVSKNQTKFDDCDRIKIDDGIFAMAKGGNKLIPLSIPFRKTSVDWNGKHYSVRPSGSLKHSSRRARGDTDYCRYFSRTGICHKGNACNYKHERERIRLCIPFLNGKCFNKQCLLSHSSNEFNTPLCKYYLEKKCSNSQCRYKHTTPKGYEDSNTEIWTCRPFAIAGWCIRGDKCPFLHLLQCPDFEETGKCPRGKSCFLSHPYTLRTQELMTLPGNKYQREQKDEEILIESDDEREKQVINSYTVDPSLLFVRGKLENKYDFYIDQPTQEKVQPNEEFMIHLESESEDETSGSDLEANSDYIGV